MSSKASYAHSAGRAVTLVLMMSGCSKPAELVGTTKAAIMVGAQISISSNNPNLDTPSAATPAANTYIVAAEDHARHLPVWVRSTTNGATWNTCDVTNPSNCNTVPVPMAPRQVGWGFSSKPVVAANGLGDVVVVYLGFSATASSTTPDLVIIQTSADNGATFQHAAVVNDNTGGNCNSALEDSPDVTFDLTTSPPSFWILWRHESGSSFGGCVRQGQFVSHVLHWLDYPSGVSGMVKENGADPNMGQGGMRIQAGDGIVTVGYSDNDEMVACPSVSTMNITWGTVTWSTQLSQWGNTSKVYRSGAFVSCPFGSVQNGIHSFDFLRAPDGTYYFAIADTGSPSTLHLFASGGSGTPVYGGPQFVWREFCPGYQDTPDGGPIPGGPASTWTRPGVSCPTGPFFVANALMFPTLVADGMNRVGLLDYALSSASSVVPTFWGGVSPRVATASWTAPTPVGNTFGASGTNLLNHTAMTTGTVPSASTCGASAGFFPIWVQISGSSSFLQTAAITM